MSDAKATTNSPVSFTNQILPLFNTHDITCMKPMGVELDSYAYMSVPANANNVYSHLTGAVQPQMPMGGPYWSQDDLNLFNQWMQDGYQQ